MTQGVPYSFVPGTKARADEVNANFIDVLNKISDTNDKILDVNTSMEESNDNLEKSIQSLDTKLEEKVSKCTNLSLSNLDAAGQAVLNNKANVDQIHGPWVNTTRVFLTNVSFGQNEIKIFTINDYVPNDNHTYEINVGFTVRYFSGELSAGTSLSSFLPIVYSNQHGSARVSMPFPSDRKLYLQTGAAGTIAKIELGSYRRVM